MDNQRRNSNYSLNAKFNSMHQMIADRKLQKELCNIEQEFTRDTNRLRKETQLIKQEFFKLKKEKGSLNANSLHHLEASPGIQDRFTRSKRFGSYDPAMLKARDEMEDEDEEDTRTFSEKRMDSLIHNQLSSVPTVETNEKLGDPYKRNLDRLLDNSKVAKDARITALKVKALDAKLPRKSVVSYSGSGGRRESTDSVMSFSNIVSRRSRILSMPNVTSSKSTHLLARPSLSDSNLGYPSGNFSDNRKQSINGGGRRVRKRSNSLVPPDMKNLRVEHHLSRRRSDTPLSTRQFNLGLIDETRKLTSSSTDKLPDISRG
eukprot:gene8186-9063_t